MSTIVSQSTRRNASPASASGTQQATRTPAPAKSADSVEATRRDELLREVHWLRPDGGVCFAPAGESARDAARRRELLIAAVREFGDAELIRTARPALARNGKPAAEAKKIAKPAPSYHSEALRATVLRTDWSPQGVQLAIDWSRPVMEVELAAGRDVVISGPMPPVVAVNGHARAPVGQWEEVCRVTENGAEYLELEIELAGGVRLQRQFVLSRRDGLFWIADVAFSPTPVDWQIETALPFAPRAELAAAGQTREISGTVGRRTVALLPTALPEWRVERRGGELALDGRIATLRQTAAQATALYAPLCIVFDPSRAKAECTWRQLTVGEDLKLQPADRAVGYRIQLGREQWLVYRSLTSRANRSVLGVNLQTDFLFARFKKDGVIENLVEIDD